MATTVTVALGRASCQAVWKVSLPPAASSTTSAPRPSVQLFSTSAARGPGSTASSAQPWARASARRAGSGSTARMWAGRYSRAHIMVHRPVGPAPSTSTVSPGWIWLIWAAQ